MWYPYMWSNFSCLTFILILRMSLSELGKIHKQKIIWKITQMFYEAWGVKRAATVTVLINLNTINLPAIKTWHFNTATQNSFCNIMFILRCSDWRTHEILNSKQFFVTCQHAKPSGRFLNTLPQWWILEDL